jgi:hypothetical protein
VLFLHLVFPVYILSYINFCQFCDSDTFIFLYAVSSFRNMNIKRINQPVIAMDINEDATELFVFEI